jgi:hypothetical protein
VELIVAEASKAMRLDDNGADTAWFVQVDEDQVLCIWDWADEATEHVEVDLVPGASPTSLAIRWRPRCGLIDQRQLGPVRLSAHL